MLAHISGYWISQLVFVAAQLGLADELQKGPRTPAALAKRVGADPEALHRVLRALASVGVFSETADGKFKSNPVGATLRSGTPGSLKDFASMIVDDYNWNAWGGLLDGVKNGSLPFHDVFGKPIFEYLRERPEKDRVFAASMASLSGPENAAIAKAFDFNRLGTLVDVGGAHGHLLGTILRRHRQLRGVLFDQPQVVAAAREDEFLAAKAVAGRVKFEGGSFFDAVPDGADAYIMKYVLHDWNDEQCLTILRKCRDAMASGGRVLVVEHVIQSGNKPDWGKLLDTNMFVLTGGRERTREEFAKLFGRAGLRLKKVHSTESALSILETVAK